MKKNIFIIVFFMIFSYGVAEAGGNIVAVQSIRVKPYEKAVKGFKSSCRSKLKRIFISESKAADAVVEITAMQPDMIIAVGIDALSTVKKIKNIPIVYLMILNPHATLSEEKNITGVSLNVPQSRQLDILLKIIPELKSIGLFYNPERTGNLVARAKKAAPKVGINLMAKEVSRSSEVPVFLKQMEAKFDIFWMLPDMSVITPETVEALLLFSIENKIPLLAFSQKYVDLGAMVSIGIDAYDIGSQAGEMAKRILSGTDVSLVQPECARKAVVSINRKVAKKMGIHIDEKKANSIVIVN